MTTKNELDLLVYVDSIVLIHLLACICGSTHRGHLFWLLFNIHAFSIDNMSFGKNCFVTQVLTINGVNKLFCRENWAEYCIPRLSRSFFKFVRALSR